jgi:hypothetical protein
MSAVRTILAYPRYLGYQVSGRTTKTDFPLVTVRYRRISMTREVKLTSTLRSVDLKRVGGSDTPGNSQVTGPKGVDLKRVGGGTRDNTMHEIGITDLWLAVA